MAGRCQFLGGCHDGGDAGREHAQAVVLDHEFQAPGGLVDGHRCVAGHGVFGNVGQAFLHDVEHLDFLVIGEVQMGNRVPNLQRDAVAVEESIGDALERMQQAQRIHARAKVGHDLAQVVVHLAHRLLDVGKILDRLRVVVGQNGVVEQGQAHARVSHGLRDRIVHFVDHFLAFLHHS